LTDLIRGGSGWKSRVLDVGAVLVDGGAALRQGKGAAHAEAYEHCPFINIDA